MNEFLTPAQFLFRAMNKAMELSMDSIELDAVFAHAGVAPQLLLASNSLITVRDAAALVGSMQELSQDPALGLHLGKDMGVEIFDLVGMIVSTAPDLRAACQMASQYAALVGTLSSFELMEQADEAWLLWNWSDEAILASAFLAPDMATATVFNGMRRLLKAGLCLKRVHYRHSEPAWTEEYVRIFGEDTEIRFGAREDALVFDRRYLDLPLVRHSPDLYKHLREQAALRLAAMPNQESTNAIVQRLIDDSFGIGLIDLSLTAEKMGINPRALQRRVREENVYFGKLLEGCRFRRARELLSESDMEVNELAAHLGYSEESSFYRAFKVWSGLTPNEYRLRYRQKEMPSSKPY